ncbi:hypothetical protein IKW75_02845 [Candidatus Saccharibacteria bacterium]|nr:hypothetical protein [Candidatus Saccharibacteria bacterium]
MSKSKKFNFLSGFAKSFKKSRSRILRKKIGFKNAYLKSYKSHRDAIRNGYTKSYNTRKNAVLSFKTTVTNGYTEQYANVSDAIRNGYSEKYSSVTNVFMANPALRPSIIAAIFFVVGLFVGIYVAPTHLTAADTGLALDGKSNNLAAYDKITTEEADLPTISATNYSSIQSTTTSDTILSVSADNIIAVEPDENNTLYVPDYGVSHWGTLYMGHTPGIFSNLQYAKSGQKIVLGDKSYTITSVQVGLKITGDTTVSGYSMSYLGKGLGANQIALITCFGSSNRTIVFATLD